MNSTSSPYTTTTPYQSGGGYSPLGSALPPQTQTNLSPVVSGSNASSFRDSTGSSSSRWQYTESQSHVDFTQMFNQTAGKNYEINQRFYQGVGNSTTAGSSLHTSIGGRERQTTLLAAAHESFIPGTSIRISDVPTRNPDAFTQPLNSIQNTFEQMTKNGCGANFEKYGQIHQRGIKATKPVL